MLEHLRRRPVPWNYQKSRDLAPYAFERKVPLTALRAACLSIPTETGRSANWEVVQMVRAASAGREVRCHATPDGLFRVRRDLAIRVAANFYFVEGERTKILWLQPRRGYALNEAQLGMFGALARMALLVEHFETAELEILDLSAPEPKAARVSRILHLSDLPAVSDDDVEAAIQRVVSAYDAIVAMNLDWDALRGRTTKRKDRPSDQPDMGF
ncbi:hypothetical protein [Roseomonas indoligenes]|uniref:Uncharacterized protein n=1 Tax=Roseomonas indoligenes TaxID=2820811 RepID=A0A940MXG3_9PROT|nr:hypothetical protein [Pararoseomonas indoligenes]MBP0492780.1 hypothetical protein [Pararoseomonas indoligenes]